MTRWMLPPLILAAAGLARANDLPPDPCAHVQFVPPDGSTNVPLDTRLRLTSGARCGTPKLTRDDGTEIALTRATHDGFVEFTPESPLESDRTYTFDLGVTRPGLCATSPSFRLASTFETRAKPRIRHIGRECVHEGDQYFLGAIHVAFSEEAVLEELLGGAFVSARSGDLALTLSPSSTADTATFTTPGKALTAACEEPVIIRVKRELPFVSGASLPEDLERTFDEPYLCEDDGSACASAPGSTALAGVALLLATRRRPGR